MRMFLLTIATSLIAFSAMAQDAEIDRIADEASGRILQPSDQRMLDLKNTQKAQMKKAFRSGMKNMTDSEKKMMLKFMDSAVNSADQTMARPNVDEDAAAITEEARSVSKNRIPADEVNYKDPEDFDRYFDSLSDDALYEPTFTTLPLTDESRPVAVDIPE